MNVTVKVFFYAFQYVYVIVTPRWCSGHSLHCHQMVTGSNPDVSLLLNCNLTKAISCDDDDDDDEFYVQRQVIAMANSATDPLAS